MKPLSPDTSVEAQQMQYKLMSQLSPSRRLALAFELTRFTRSLIISDLRHRYPQASSEEIRRRFIARVLSREDVIRAFGFDPIKEGY